MNDIKLALTRAINGLMINNPFYASILLKQEIVIDASCKTASTDGKTLRINAEFFLGLSHEQQKTLLAHEVEHTAKLHHTRRHDREPERWNKAADYAVNQILEDGGFEPIPGFWHREDRFKDKCAEEIYRILEQEESEQDKQQNGQGGANGQPGGQDKQETVGDITDAPEPGTAEQETMQAVQQATALAKRMGKLPEAIERNLGNVSASGDPRELLARFITERANTDYSWAKPNKRYIPHDLYVPGLENKTLGKFVIAVDTSGSISEKEIQKSVEFILSCLDSLADFGGNVQSVTVVYCDSAVQHVEELEHGQRCKPKGGGGTDFKPPFAYVDNEDLQPAGMIYLTDGCCDSFPSAPTYPVLWGLFCACASFKPPFGETVELFNL